MKKMNHTYKAKLDAALKTMIACNITVPTDEDIITKFIDGLSSDYDELKLKIRNDEFSGIPTAWPTTLDQAYIRAAKFMTSTTIEHKTSTNEERTIAFIGTVNDLNTRRQQLKTNRRNHSNTNQNKPPIIQPTNSAPPTEPPTDSNTTSTIRTQNHTRQSNTHNNTQTKFSYAKAPLSSLRGDALYQPMPASKLMSKHYPTIR